MRSMARGVWVVGLCMFLLAGAAGASAQEGDQEGSLTSPTEGAKEFTEDAPVPVPEATEKAVRYYRSGNWIW